MNLESLANEILFDIFDFLDDIHILRAFHNLNYRFNHLILAYFRVSRQLNLSSITKSDFDMACRYYISLITDNIKSLRLSNDDTTPQQIDRFLSYGFTLHKFSYLESLSLDHMHSEQTINRMMLQWQYSSNLTHLNITHCQVLNTWNIVYLMINSIWSLPKLTHCHLDIDVIDEDYSIVPTVTSSSLEYLSIKNLNCNFSELIHLFEHTPRLRYLDITVNEESTNQPLFPSLLLMTTLKLNYDGPFDLMKNLLEHMPNLLHLSVKTENIYIEGHQWEAIIINHLSNLQVFHFLMELESENTVFRLKDLIKTYKTRFWLEDHQWYVQGHCYYMHPDNTVFLYTLPYAFVDYHIPCIGDRLLSESTNSDYHDDPYKYVHHLSCDSLPEDRYQFRYRFFDVHYLTMTVPSHDNFWIFVPRFNQLQVLDISLSSEEVYNKEAFQLETLLERAPKLSSLSFAASIDALLPLLECPSKSVVKLDLVKCDGYFNHSDCSTLILSDLGKQCQILSIKVQDRMNIIQLVNEMPQIRSLNVKCPPQNYKTDLSLLNNDVLTRWLQHHLPSTCSITRNSILPDKVQIWIR